MTTKVDLDLSLTRTFTPSVGTPSTFVVLDEFLLKEGESRQVFLEKSAQAEAALRGETGYLGRNLLYSRQVCAPHVRVNGFPQLIRDYLDQQKKQKELPESDC